MIIILVMVYRVFGDQFDQFVIIITFSIWPKKVYLVFSLWTFDYPYVRLWTFLSFLFVCSQHFWTFYTDSVCFGTFKTKDLPCSFVCVKRWLVLRVPACLSLTILPSLNLCLPLPRPPVPLPAQHGGGAVITSAGCCGCASCARGVWPWVGLS